MDQAKFTTMNLFLALAFAILSMAMDATAQDNSTLFDRRGCFYDNFQYDILPDLINCDSALHQPCRSTCSIELPYCQSDVMTVDLCFQICINQNARYFGLQAGSQCLCGGAFAPFNSKGAPSDDSGCNKNCTGDPGQACGGSFLVIVYEIKDPTSDCFHPGFQNVKEAIFPSIDNNDFHINDTLEYNTICQSPSNLTGTPTITCTNSSWSDPPPVCNIRCSRPEPEQYAVFHQMTTSSFEIGETLSYSCVVNDINRTTECDHRGLWTPIDCPAACSKSDLPIGGALASAPLNVDYFAVGALVNFVCDTVPLRTEFVCEDSGSWNISGFLCADITISSPTTPPMPSQPSTSGGYTGEGTMPNLQPTESSTTEIAESEESNEGWIIAVAVIIPLILIVIIIIVIIIYYRKRKDEQKRHVPQVVLGYIKKRGTLGGTLKRNHDPEKDLTDNPEADSDHVKKGGTLTHSLSAVKQQFVKRVTLNRNRPELPPKKNPKKSSSRSVTGHAEVGYIAPKGVKSAGEVDVIYPNAKTKRVSTISMVSHGDSGLDEVFNTELRTSRSSEMLDALMVEFDGRVNHGFENEDSSTAQSSPSLAPKTSPETEHVVVHAAHPASPKANTDNAETSFQSPAHSNGVSHSGEEDASNNNDSSPQLIEDSSSISAPVSDQKALNGDYLNESPYDTLGAPKPAPPEVLNTNGVIEGDGSPHYESTRDKTRPGSLTLNTNDDPGYEKLPGQESPQYASLADVQSPNGVAGTSGSPLTKHDYVNVGRGVTVPSARISAEFHHPRPPSLPPDDSS